MGEKLMLTDSVTYDWIFETFARGPEEARARFLEEAHQKLLHANSPIEVAQKALKADSPLEVAQKALKADSPLEAAQKLLEADSLLEAAQKLLQAEQRARLAS